jgi:hypothetical protein
VELICRSYCARIAQRQSTLWCDKFIQHNSGHFSDDFPIQIQFIYLSTHPSIHPSTQQILTKYLLGSKHCSEHWKHDSEQSDFRVFIFSFFLSLHISWRSMTRKKILKLDWHHSMLKCKYHNELETKASSTKRTKNF